MVLLLAPAVDYAMLFVSIAAVVEKNAAVIEILATEMSSAAK